MIEQWPYPKIKQRLNISIIGWQANKTRLYKYKYRIIKQSFPPKYTQLIKVIKEPTSSFSRADKNQDFEWFVRNCKMGFGWIGGCLCLCLCLCLFSRLLEKWRLWRLTTSWWT